MLDGDEPMALRPCINECPVQRNLQLPGYHAAYLQRRLPAEKSTGLVQSCSLMRRLGSISGGGGVPRNQSEKLEKRGGGGFCE